MVHHDGYELYISWCCCCCCCWGDMMPLCVCWGPLFTFWPPFHCIDYHVFDTAWIELKFSASWRYSTGLPATFLRIPRNARKKFWELTTGVQSGTAPNKKSRFWCQHPFSFFVFQQAILYRLKFHRLMFIDMLDDLQSRKGPLDAFEIPSLGHLRGGWLEGSQITCI